MTAQSFEELQAHEVERWSAFASRVTLTFAFHVNVLVSPSQEQPTRAEMTVMLFVPERDTREEISVSTRRPCPPWVDDRAAIDMLFDLIRIALEHETRESVLVDGKRVRDPHRATP